jgi:hypothetical protein
MMGLLAKATQTRFFARVQNPAICGGLDFITEQVYARKNLERIEQIRGE